MNYEFWMVYLQGERTPVYKHETLESAQKEAERLTLTYHKPAFILRAVKKIEEAPRIITTELKMALPF